MRSAQRQVELRRLINQLPVFGKANSVCKVVIFCEFCLFATYTPFTLALLIRSETGFAPMRAFTLHQLIRINDLIRIKLNHLLEVVSHRFSLLRVLIASVDATGTRIKAEQI